VYWEPKSRTSIRSEFTVGINMKRSTGSSAVIAALSRNSLFENT